MTAEKPNFTPIIPMGFFVTNKATDIGFLYISKKAFNVLTELRNTRMLNSETEPIFEVYHAEYEKHTKALDNLIDTAKKELKFK